MSYSPPASAKPFTLNIPDQDISEWRQLLELARLGPNTFENQQTERNFGITQKWLSDTRDYWLNTFDWHAQEKHINSFNNFKMQIDEIDLHFIAQFSEKKDAVPIIFMHGWPGSFIEFLPMLELLRKKYKKEDSPYHIIVASLPGYTLSGSGPLDRNWTIEDSARIINRLMVNLGFSKYIAQGGDVGSMEARLLAVEYDECVAIHLNFITSAEQPDIEKLSTSDKKLLERGMRFRESGMAYAMEHGSRPSTIGHVLSSSPLALLAWIGEKFIEWTDTTPSLDHILTNISLYWFTGGFPRSIYPYRQLFGSSRAHFDYVKKPTGISYFPMELFPMFEPLVAKSCNLVQFKQHDSGGHFAALEKPAELLADVEEFVQKVWKV